MLKRVMTTLIGIVVLVAIFILDSLNIINGPIFFNVALTSVALMMTHEFYNAVEKKGVKPIRNIGYIASLAILPIGLLKPEVITLVYFLLFPILLFVSFMKSILTNIKFNIIDIAATILAPLYTTFLSSFIAHTRAMENGVWYVWFIFGGAWFTDIFAFLIGKSIGKHKLSKISPNKSWEGCIAGTLGCAIFYMIYAIVLQNMHLCELNYLLMGILGLVVSVISQIGDFSASSIKRYCEIKDFSDLMPGHGGMLDRFDSVLFIAPVIYLTLSIIL